MKLASLSHLAWTLVVAFALSGCGSGFETYKSLMIDGDGVREVEGVTPPSQVNESLKFCSPLSFEKVVWNNSLNQVARRSFAIALSITGSFEGHQGWSNITNNFDGQGLSAGLLNQTLGTQSLQPLLLNMLKNKGSEFSSSFTAANDQSISRMLKDWQALNPTKALTKLQSEEVEVLPYTEIQPVSVLNQDVTGFSTKVEATAAKNPSVQWAIDNLYVSGGAFKTDWKAQIQSLLVKPNYVSLQITAAEKIHNKAMTYVKRVGISDLRTYLLMFDFVTQNGSITEDRFKEWEAKVVASKLKDKVAILKALVDIRVQDTKAEYREDVRSRKYALITGTGKVHGSTLNLPVSYCYKSTDPIQ